MIARKLAVALSGAVLALSPISAQAAPVERAAAPTAAENDLGGSLLWIALLVAVVIGAILLLDDDDNDPVSP